MQYGYTGQYNAQTLTDWTSEWGGGTLPRSQHGTALITPGMSVRMTPGGAWDTFYQLQRMAGQSGCSTVVYHIAYQVSDADLPACQALEFEIQKNEGAAILNGGVQFDIKGSKCVRTYDYGVEKWMPTAIPCDDSLLAGGKLLDVVCVYDLQPAAIRFRGLQINGVWNALGIVRPSVPKSQHPYLNYAFQWDFTKSTHAATLTVPCCDITVT